MAQSFVNILAEFSQKVNPICVVGMFFCVIGMFGAFSAQKMRYGLARNHSAFQHIFR